MTALILAIGLWAIWYELNRISYIIQGHDCSWMRKTGEAMICKNCGRIYE